MSVSSGGGAKKVFSDALALPTPQRAELVGRLLASLDDDQTEALDAAEWTAAWDAEIARRVQAIEAGESVSAPIDEALERIFARE